MTPAALVADAVAVLRAVAGAASRGDAATRLAGEVEAAWTRAPRTVGLRGGDVRGRTALLDALAGGGLVGARAGGGAPIRLRRGARTKLVATRANGDVESVAMLVEIAPVPVPVGWLARLRARIARLFGRRRGSKELDAFVARLRELCAADVAGARVVEVALEVARGPLPADVEVIEVSGEDAGDARELDATLDVTAGARTALGDPARTAAALAAFVDDARAVRLATRALDAAADIVAAVDAEDRRVAADFAGRVADLEDLRIADPESFTRDQLARVSAQIVPSVTMVIEHVAAHLGGDLAQLAGEWRGAIERVSTRGELGDAVSQIDDTSAAAVRRIADDARLLLTGGVAGCVRDLAAGVIAPLGKHGLSEALASARTATAPAALATPVLASLSRPGASVDGAGWFRALFRSLESRRAGIRDKVEQHIARLEEVAVAEMRDAEPRLRAAVEDALAVELAAAIDRQRVWLEGAIAVEHAEFAMRRESVALRTAQVDLARRDLRRLRHDIAARARAPGPPA